MRHAVLAEVTITSVDVDFGDTKAERADLFWRSVSVRLCFRIFTANSGYK
jgi:hypothetical protein